MIYFIIGFFVGAAVATTILVLVGKRSYKRSVSLFNKNARDIIINNKG